MIIDPATCAFVDDANALGPVREFIHALANEADRIEAGVLLVAHGNKPSCKREAARDDPGRVAGSTAWVDAARGALTLAPAFSNSGKDRKLVPGRWELTVAKANYGATGVCLELEELTDDESRPVAYRQATAARLKPTLETSGPPLNCQDLRAKIRDTLSFLATPQHYPL